MEWLGDVTEIEVMEGEDFDGALGGEKGVEENVGSGIFTFSSVPIRFLPGRGDSPATNSQCGEGAYRASGQILQEFDLVGVRGEPRSNEDYWFIGPTRTPETQDELLYSGEIADSLDLRAKRRIVRLLDNTGRRDLQAFECRDNSSAPPVDAVLRWFSSMP